MNRAFLLALASTFCIAAFGADNKVVAFSSDKSSYQVGDKAILGARLITRPDNPNLEFDLVSKLNGVEIPIQRVTEFDFYSTATLSTVGSNPWRVTVYIQDARLARDLKASIVAFSARIAAIDEELEQNEDPLIEQELLDEKAQQERFLAASQAQLTGIRSQVYGPVGINIQVSN